MKGAYTKGVARDACRDGWSRPTVTAGGEASVRSTKMGGLAKEIV